MLSVKTPGALGVIYGAALSSRSSAGPYDIVGQKNREKEMCKTPRTF
jgi:hypothetical protein